MRYLMTFPISHAAIIIEVSWHTVGRPSDDCAASPVPTGLDGLLPGMEPHGTGLDTAAANLWRSGPIACRCCRTPLHHKRTHQSP
jgi:hypothetical protein